MSIVAFKIDTGKKHQIRAHAAQVLRAPLLFDEKYGYSKENFKHERFLGLLDKYRDVFVR